MKNFLRLSPKPLLLLLLLLSAVGLSSCATTDDENASARPWNQPIGWENGLPSGMTEGRYGR